MWIIHSKLLTKEEDRGKNTLTGRQQMQEEEEKKRWCKIWLSWGERQTLSFVIARTQDNSTAIIFCNVSLKQVPTSPVSFQWKQRLLSHQITSHLNTHIVRISQINLIRILLPGVPPGCNQLHCIWIKLTSCCHSRVILDCLHLVKPVSKQRVRWHAVMWCQTWILRRMPGHLRVRRKAAARGISMQISSGSELSVLTGASPWEPCLLMSGITGCLTMSGTLC